MNYEVVELAEKIVAGTRFRTKNSDPQMPAGIGKLWQDFFAEHGAYSQISHKVNASYYNLYTNYESDVHGAYDVVACCEVSSIEGLSEELYHTVIPAGKYARFTLEGDAQVVIPKFWQDFWATMNLNRKYTVDFEEYFLNQGNGNTTMYVYIALQDE